MVAFSSEGEIHRYYLCLCACMYIYIYTHTFQTPNYQLLCVFMHNITYIHYIYIYIYTCTHVYEYIRIYTTSTYKHTNKETYILTHIGTPTLVRSYSSLRQCEGVYTYTYMCVYAYPCTYIHTNIHTQVHRPSSGPIRVCASLTSSIHIHTYTYTYIHT